MSNHINLVVMIGEVISEPKHRVFDSGDQIASFRLKTTKVYRTKHGEIREIDYQHNVTVRGKFLSGIVMKDAQVGATVKILGEMSTRSWEKDGQKHYLTEVSVASMDGQFMKIDDPVQVQQPAMGHELESDIPF